MAKQKKKEKGGEEEDDKDSDLDWYLWENPRLFLTASTKEKSTLLKGFSKSI